MKVIIIGKTAEGKSTVAALLCRALNDCGIYCEIADSDGDTHPLTVNSIELGARVESLRKKGAQVDVEMQQQDLAPTGRTPRPLLHPSLRPERHGSGVTIDTSDIDFTSAEISVVASLVEKFKAAYPEVVDYMDVIKKHAAENKYIRSTFGKKIKVSGVKTSRMSSSKGLNRSVRPSKRGRK